MKLEFSILWFDDSEEFFDAMDFGYIEGEIKGWGFEPEIITVKTAAEFEAHSPYESFDLLVVDYNLENDGHGQNFIEKIRSLDVYTEVVFYSAGGVSLLWDAIYANKLEGIYIATRAQIETKILEVGRQTIRKVLDLENMRGIVMSEVGDLDAVLEKIFVKAMDGVSDEARSDVFKRFHDKATEQAEKSEGALASFIGNPSVDELLKLCDSDKRWQNYNRVKRHHDILKKKKLGNYVDEVLTPRNFLAHGVPERIDGSGYTFTFNGKSFDFNDDVGRGLRHKILEFKKAFTEIEEVLNQ